jgi:hypothetical protein
VYKGVYEGLKILFHDHTPTMNKDDRGILYSVATLDQMYKRAVTRLWLSS